MRPATPADVDLIKSILLLSFKNDPHLTWLLEESRNKFKLNVLIDYVVHQTLRRGAIYLTDDNNAVALWDFERNEKMSFHHIWRNLAFLIQIGTTSVARILKSDTYVHHHFRKYPRYCHLYMIGVLPEAQGKGSASTLMNPMIQMMKDKSIPVFLETANPSNVDIYKKKGFEIFETLLIGDRNLFLMSNESSVANVQDVHRSPMRTHICFEGNLTGWMEPNTVSQVNDGDSRNCSRHYAL